MAHFKNTASNLWRDDYGLFGLFSIVSAFFRILYGVIMILFWSLPTRLNLTGIQVLTRFFTAFYVLDLLLIIGQVIARCVYLILEGSYNWKMKEHRPLKIDSSSQSLSKPGNAKGY